MENLFLAKLQLVHPEELERWDLLDHPVHLELRDSLESPEHPVHEVTKETQVCVHVYTHRPLQPAKG